MNQQYLKNVATLEFNPGKCIGCGMCIDVCPHQVFQLESSKAQIVDRDRCMECGACAKNCPAEAITVQPGVGCAAAIIRGILTGSEPTCGCSEDSGKGGCCG